MLIILQDDIVGIAERALKMKDLTTNGILVAMIIFLIFAIKHYKKELAEKDKRIREVVENHLNDIRKHTNDFISVNKDTNALIEELKKIYSGDRKTG